MDRSTPLVKQNFIHSKSAFCFRTFALTLGSSQIAQSRLVPPPAPAITAYAPCHFPRLTVFAIAVHTHKHKDAVLIFFTASKDGLAQTAQRRIAFAEPTNTARALRIRPLALAALGGAELIALRVRENSFGLHANFT